MEFLNVMLKVWMKYWNLFLQGLGMTLFMGLLTVLISTVFGSLMALMRRSNVGISLSRQSVVSCLVKFSARSQGSPRARRNSRSA